MKVEEIKQLIKALDETNLTSLEIQGDDFSLKLKKGEKPKGVGGGGGFSGEILNGGEILATKSTGTESSAAPISPISVSCEVAQSHKAESTPQPKQTTPQDSINTNKNISNAEFITSPMVGTFYRAASPGAAPFVSIGDSIKKGQVIGIVEAMKIMNEIEAEYNCKIIEIEVNDAQPVEFGTKLMMIEKI